MSSIQTLIIIVEVMFTISILLLRSNWIKFYRYPNSTCHWIKTIINKKNSYTRIESHRITRYYNKDNANII